jgi:type VI secretion system protein ImpL
VLKRDAIALPAGVGAVVTEIANRSVAVVRGAGGANVSNTYAQQVLAECRALASGRYPFVTGSANDIPITDFERLFGPNGVYDSYFKTVLQDLVNTTRTPWTWRTDTSGVSVAVAGVPLGQFEAVQRLREMFFRGSEVQLRFTVTVEELDSTSTRFTLGIDGQDVVNRHDPARAFQLTWPGPKPGFASTTFEPAGGPNFAFEGPWAVFRLIDAGRLDRQTDSRYLLQLERGTREVQLRIEADSSRNPFGGKSELQRFRCE